MITRKRTFRGALAMAVAAGVAAVALPGTAAERAPAAATVRAATHVVAPSEVAGSSDARPRKLLHRLTGVGSGPGALFEVHDRRGNTVLTDGAPLLDITAVNPSVGGAAGGIISSGSDVDRFLGALAGGELLHPSQLKEMMKTVPTGSADGRRYGLGLESTPLPRGGRYWGHTGDFFGYETTAGARVDGRQATVMVNLGPGSSDARSDGLQAAVETALARGR
ncbi:serine hydrolase [Streptomyces sp. NPDC018007]|uniref:serine hydrolase n=1 Tax=Streptomyces sp. NPDC018007 TaxID=3365029 RepID=UPI003799A5D5